MDQKIKCAVVGCGHIGARHIQIIREHVHLELVATVDISAPVINYDVPHYNDIQSLFSSGVKPDLVCIATPNGLHESQAIEALESNAHVVIEKPMALTVEGAEKIVQSGGKNGKHIFPVMQNRFSPACIWLKNIIDKNILGDIFMVQVNCFWNRDDRYYVPGSWHGTSSLDGGTLYTQFSHFIDMMYFLFGDMVNITGRSANFAHKQNVEFEDSGIIQFDFNSGAIGSLNFSTAVWNENLESSISIIAENGTVKLAGPYMEDIVSSSIRNFDEQINGQHHFFPEEAPDDSKLANHKHFYDHVVRVLHKETNTTLDQDSVKVIGIINKMYNALNKSSNTAFKPKSVVSV